MERKAIEEGHLPGLGAVSARGAGGHEVGACVVCGEQQSLRDWRKKQVGVRAGRTVWQALGLGSEWGHRTGLFGGWWAQPEPHGVCGNWGSRSNRMEVGGERRERGKET